MNTHFWNSDKEADLFNSAESLNQMSDYLFGKSLLALHSGDESREGELIAEAKQAEKEAEKVYKKLRKIHTCVNCVFTEEDIFENYEWALEENCE